ncbi:hypothetical protein IEN85_20930 [Pelagicoccus sp. NFK12]|uniref:Uncharacterized protein n=1 Tax=Pelagicoccus enzymogenes TaxID=2773457 RepID=A0A927IH78_9BACT|nr:hypothetical protein [Pelagicoccus enzymogenes]MBD5781977.1 hypothetical protein [Pelagicoccus enzymogenes]MDQ8196732.1 hypothetical protein [Pelagicoccus enzymogenes]
MTIIIRDELLNPPTWFASFRDLTLICSLRLESDILIESLHADLYYKWLRPRGGMDFIADFVSPGSEDGLHIDIEHQYAPSIVVDRIVPENTHQLFQSIRSAVGI